jgi:hypothetical protein
MKGPRKSVENKSNSEHSFLGLISSLTSWCPSPVPQGSRSIILTPKGWVLETKGSKLKCFRAHIINVCSEIVELKGEVCNVWFNWINVLQGPLELFWLLRGDEKYLKLLDKASSSQNVTNEGLQVAKM